MTGPIPDCYGLTAMDDQSRGAHAEPQQPAGMDQAMSVLSYLITGIGVWGGLGWLVDHVWHLGFALPIGIVVGAALGCYLVIVRFGALKDSKAATTPLPNAQLHQSDASPTAGDGSWLR